LTYFGFLALFLGIPIAALCFLTLRDYRRGRALPRALHTWSPWSVLAVLCGMAFIYTTPWDNYLVATRVWWYDIDLVSGIVIGWVPIEEYTFFILQPIMTGLWLLFLLRRLPVNQEATVDSNLRRKVTIMTTGFWLVMVAILLLTVVSEVFQPASYLALELSWALIPLVLQLAFGADILWRYRWILLLAIVTSTAYLSFADALAIGSGTWTINPEQSLNIVIGGVLPLEELLFFLLTNTLVVFGMTLLLAKESQQRVGELERFAILRPLVHLLPKQKSTSAELV